MKPTLAASGMFIQARPACMARELMLCLSILILLGLVCGCTPLQSNNSRTTLTANGLPISINIGTTQVNQPLTGYLVVYAYPGNPEQDEVYLKLDVRTLEDGVPEDGAFEWQLGDLEPYEAMKLEQNDWANDPDHQKRISYTVTPKVVDNAAPPPDRYHLRSLIKDDPEDDANAPTTKKKNLGLLRVTSGNNNAD